MFQGVITDFQIFGAYVIVIFLVAIATSGRHNR